LHAATLQQFIQNLSDIAAIGQQGRQISIGTLAIHQDKNAAHQRRQPQGTGLNFR
jgi:hypothetical protein